MMCILCDVYFIWSMFVEPLGIYCMDHQAAKRNKISFLAATGKDRFHLVWTGVIVVDDDNNSAKPFRIETKNAIFKQQDE